ncbi:hypothetical protein DKM44_10800 [Deinococcus irradiatisoli]|uniref:Uncharacterized protein n=1 Tax=Deinococcus irradiatisoli TaxID=2202254 RepID=A0A2Z3JEN6_9DEIO|nr:hypothetical protein DKM44_10800 [Deinococcus irradiatisoli]
MLTERPQHRDTLAALLWSGPNSMNNLRVELSKLRAAGLELGPNGAPLVSFTADSDVQQWLSSAQNGAANLKAIQGLPLEGLEDVGGAAYQDWIQARRQRLIQLLTPAMNRLYLADTSEEFRRQLQDSAARLGILLVSLPQTGIGIQIVDEVSSALQEALKAATREPRLLVYSGRPGSGRGATLRAVSAAEGWLLAEVDVVKHPGLLVAAMIMRIIESLPPEDRPLLEQVLISAETPEANMIRLASLLRSLHRPLMLVLHGTRMLQAESVQHLEFLMNWPVPLVMVLMSSVADTAPLLRMLDEQARTRNRRLLSQPRLFPSALDGRVNSDPDSNGRVPAALKVLQQAEGWLAAAQVFLPQVSTSEFRFSTTERLRRLLLLDVDSAVPGFLETLSRLAALWTPFTEAQAALHLQDVVPAAQVEAVLARAMDANILVRAPAHITVRLPGLKWRVPDGDDPLVFASELQRAAFAGTLDANLRARLRRVAAVDDGAPTGWLPLLWQPASRNMERRSSQPRASTWLPGGYHLIVEQGQFHVLRLSVPQPNTQELTLRWDAPAGLPWTVTAQLGAFSGNRVDYPLGVCLSAGREVLAPPHMPPLNQLFSISGLTTKAGLELTIRASDLILTINQVSIGGQEMEF